MSAEAKSLPAASLQEAVTPQLRADIAIRPALNAGAAIEKFLTRCGPLEPIQIAHALRSQMDEVATGKLRRQEDTLVAQSHTLDALFSNLLQAALGSKEMHKMETYMRLAFKAQSQCRTTIETLNLMKNPPSAMFVKQANLANGPQQVNNGVRAGEIEKQQNELLALEQRDGTHVDFGATTTPIGAHSKVASLGSIKRTANDDGKGSCEP